MTNDELKLVLEKHKKWLAKEPNGARADLHDADLRGVDLSNTNLSGADLQRVDLTGANLRGANLSGVDLSGADLEQADLSGADLHAAKLLGACLFGADLREVDLRSADLRHVAISGDDLRGADIDYSAWPLWCGSLNVRIDKRIACQLLYHVLNAMQSVDDPEVRKVCGNPDVVTLANKFHRILECGELKPVKEGDPCPRGTDGDARIGLLARLMSITCR